MTQERFDRWFNNTAACLLNITLAATLLIAHSL